MKKKNNVNSKNKLNDKDTFQIYYAAILLWIDTEKLALVHIWFKNVLINSAKSFKLLRAIFTLGRRLFWKNPPIFIAGWIWACVNGRNQSLKRLFCLGWTGYPAQAHDFVGILQKSPISSLAGWFGPSTIMCYGRMS